MLTARDTDRLLASGEAPYGSELARQWIDNDGDEPISIIDLLVSYRDSLLPEHDNEDESEQASPPASLPASPSAKRSRDDDSSQDDDDMDTKRRRTPVPSDEETIKDEETTRDDELSSNEEETMESPPHPLRRSTPPPHSPPARPVQLTTPPSRRGTPPHRARKTPSPRPSTPPSSSPRLASSGPLQRTATPSPRALTRTPSARTPLYASPVPQETEDDAVSSASTEMDAALPPAPIEAFTFRVNGGSHAVGITLDLSAAQRLFPPSPAVLPTTKVLAPAKFPAFDVNSALDAVQQAFTRDARRPVVLLAPSFSAEYLIPASSATRDLPRPRRRGAPVRFQASEHAEARLHVVTYYVPRCEVQALLGAKRRADALAAQFLLLLTKGMEGEDVVERAAALAQSLECKVGVTLG